MEFHYVPNQSENPILLFVVSSKILVRKRPQKINFGVTPSLAKKKAGISSNLFLKLAKSIQKLDCNYNFPIDLTHNGIPFDVTQSEK